MKNLFLLLVLCVTLLSCEKKPPFKEYKIYIEKDDLAPVGLDLVRQEEEDTLMARNDTLAYNRAVFIYYVNKRIVEDTEPKIGAVYGFRLADMSGEDVSDKLSLSIKDNALKLAAQKSDLREFIEADQLEKARQDSIAQVEQQKVIGDIMFGMPEKEAKPKIEKFIKESSKKKYANLDILEGFIGNYEFSKYSTKDYYHKDSLYRFDIMGNYIHWEKFNNEVPREVNNITEVIKMKYGEPTLKHVIPERHQMEKDLHYLINAWTVGTKRIEVSVTDRGIYCTVDVDIYQPTVVDRIRAESIAEANNEAQKDKDVF